MEFLLRLRLHLFRPAIPIENVVLCDLDAFRRDKAVAETGAVVACNRARGQRSDVVIVDVDPWERNLRCGQRDHFDVRDANSCVELRRSPARAPGLKEEFADQEEAERHDHSEQNWGDCTFLQAIEAGGKGSEVERRRDSGDDLCVPRSMASCDKGFEVGPVAPRLLDHQSLRLTGAGVVLVMVFEAKEG